MMVLGLLSKGFASDPKMMYLVHGYTLIFNMDGDSARLTCSFQVKVLVYFQKNNNKSMAFSETRKFHLDVHLPGTLVVINTFKAKHMRKV